MNQYREGKDDSPPVKTRDQIVEERLQALQDDPVVEETTEDPVSVEDEEGMSTGVLLIKMKDGRILVETKLSQIPLDHEASPAEVATILEETKESMFISRIVNAMVQVQKMAQMEAMSMLGKKGGKVNPRELLSQLRMVPR